ncbi:cryptochrome/photolyase family protein [Devosia psychrophila]|uniref:Deoxyribodipyrimidine photolyase n=1 Tax=Devosia psychrophila TaxID=728005 RepID=A0A0F5PSZ0_9HYPH|nr:cryptochrome/photolyase family protein [Devosia psychrophila]KKC31521.1 deoxyribodipyrimidine photolyase [Devosia psychrophila]SFB97958.1 deoxyribodipyrimidine photolyase-related protein [Devosia psychrophila]
MDLVVILGDQLTLDVTALRASTPETAVVLMAEVGTETSYAWHHKQKLVLVLSAMRHFADELRQHGWMVDYVTLPNPNNTQSLDGEVLRAVGRHTVERIVTTEAAEWRVRAMQRGWAELTGLSVEIEQDDRFIASHATFDGWADGRREWTMEFFYREMRRKTGLLLDGGRQPLGGRWNFDAENRKTAKPDLFMPKPLSFPPDTITREVMELVSTQFADNPGRQERFGYAVTRADAERARAHFLDAMLPRFGDYQDAMLTSEQTLYHSVLSPYINLGLLDPLALCRAAEVEYLEGRAPLNSVEGFIRQIIGWREYMRGVYWHEMPAYRDRNALGAKLDLPWFYWDGQTEMNCLAQAIGQTLETAYAHHIQRLMITGNFAMLAGVDPFQVHEWYLAIYIDAFEWVELPNTLGMSQFGDGGLVGSKPYAASANYISKMSDYCEGCRFNPKLRHGPNACPFNALYWDFLARNRQVLAANTRMKRNYMVWDRMDPAEQSATLAHAAVVLGHLETEAKRRSGA